MQSIIIISKNKNFTELLKNYLNEIFQEILSFDEVSFDCLNLLKSDNKIILLDADEDKSAIKKIIQRNNTTKIIAISADATTSNVINIMRQGAWDFLQKPILKETLLKSIDKILTKDLTCESSKIFSVFSNKGGIGKTTIAVNLAYELSKTTSQKVLLLDMNLQAGDIATFLNIDTFIDLEKLGSEKDKINSDYLESVLANYDNSNLYILSQEHNIQKAIK